VSGKAEEKSPPSKTEDGAPGGVRSGTFGSTDSKGLMIHRQYLTEIVYRILAKSPERFSFYRGRV
jgi:hypothetical protein